MLIAGTPILGQRTFRHPGEGWLGIRAASVDNNCGLRAAAGMFTRRGTRLGSVLDRCPQHPIFSISPVPILRYPKVRLTGAFLRNAIQPSIQKTRNLRLKLNFLNYTRLLIVLVSEPHTHSAPRPQHQNTLTGKTEENPKIKPPRAQPSGIGTWHIRRNRGNSLAPVSATFHRKLW